MRSSIAIAVILCGAASGCRGAPAGSSGGVDASRATALGSASSSNTHGPVPLRRPAGDSSTCRAIAVDGDVRRAPPAALGASDGGQTRLASVDEVPDGAWLSLGTGARVVLKDAHSVRETTFLGPGWVRGCVNRQTESWLGAGRFEGSLGGAEAPSAEEWVVTPLGVFRYVSAKIDIDATSNGATASIAGGTCFFWNADDTRVETRVESADGGRGGATDTTDAPWQRMGAGQVRILPGPGSFTASGAKRATDVCSVRAARAAELARALLVRDAGPAPTGETVAEQVRARRIAHASCSVARLRVELLPPNAGRDSSDPFTQVLNQADDAWSRLPLR